MKETIIALTKEINARNRKATIELEKGFCFPAGILKSLVNELEGEIWDAEIVNKGFLTTINQQGKEYCRLKITWTNGEAIVHGFRGVQNDSEKV